METVASPNASEVSVKNLLASTVKKVLGRITAPIYATVFSGSGQGTVITATDGAVLSVEGLTIIDGAAELGAGLHVESGAALTIADVILADNIAATAGGALFVSTDAGAVGTAVTFEDNEPDDISRGTKASYSADGKGGFSCAAGSEVCE